MKASLGTPTWGWGYNAWINFNWRGAMKKYLFGLGAMLVGAGLMFVLMHGEVSADSKPEMFVCSGGSIEHCETKTLDCGRVHMSISCVKK